METRDAKNDGKYSIDFSDKKRLAHTLDGYGFEGQSWSFIQYSTHIQFSALTSGNQEIKNANFLKSAPSREEDLCILIPLWKEQQEPPNLYVCWRGKPNSDFKNSALKKTAKKDYADLSSRVRSLLVQCILKLPDSSKTRRHFLLNSEPNNMIRILAEEDFDGLTITFNATTIKKELLGENDHYFAKGTSEVVLLTYELGTNIRLTKPIWSLNETCTIIQEKIFPTINPNRCTHIALHWTFDWTSEFQDAVSFFVPEELLESFSLQRSACQMYFIGFSNRKAKKQWQFGNIQCKNLSANFDRIRGLNIYKKNFVGSLLENKVLNFKYAGIHQFLDSKLLQPRIKANLEKNSAWKDKEQTEKLDGYQSKLMEENFVENLEILVDEMKGCWTKDFPCRIEVIVDATSKQLHSEEKNENLVVQSYLDTCAFIEKKLSGKNVLLRIEKNIVQDNEEIGFMPMVDLLFDLYHQYVAGFVKSCQKTFKQLNLLSIQSSPVTSKNGFDFAACAVVENLMLHFFCGHFSFKGVGKHMYKLLELCLPEKQCLDFAKVQCGQFDEQVIHLMNKLKNPTSDEKKVITEAVLEKKHYVFQPSFAMLSDVLENWHKLIFLNPQNVEDIRLTLVKFFEAFIWFFTLPNRWVGLTEFTDENVGLLCNRNYQQRMTDVQNILQAEIISTRPLQIEYHTTTWLVNVLENSVCILPNSAAVWLYKEAKLRFATQFGTDHADLWIEALLVALLESSKNNNCPILVVTKICKAKLGNNDNIILNFDFEEKASEGYIDQLNNAELLCSEPENLLPKKTSATFSITKRNRLNQSASTVMYPTVFVILPKLSENQCEKQYAKLCMRSINLKQIQHTIYIEELEKVIRKYKGIFSCSVVFLRVLGLLRIAYRVFVNPKIPEYMFDNYFKENISGTEQLELTRLGLKADDILNLGMKIKTVFSQQNIDNE